MGHAWGRLKVSGLEGFCLSACFRFSMFQGLTLRGSNASGRQDWMMRLWQRTTHFGPSPMTCSCCSSTSAESLLSSHYPSRLTGGSGIVTNTVVPVLYFRVPYHEYIVYVHRWQDVKAKFRGEAGPRLGCGDDGPMPCSSISHLGDARSIPKVAEAKRPAKTNSLASRRRGWGGRK